MLIRIVLTFAPNAHYYICFLLMPLKVILVKHFNAVTSSDKD